MATYPIKGFSWLIVLWLAVANVSTIIEATVTLTAPSSPPCFGQTYKLTCTHPVLDADTNVRWERNGTGFNPESFPNHINDDNPNPSITTLTINVTREEFENIVYNYRCLTLNTSTDTVVRVYSNDITVGPPDKPEQPHGLECCEIKSGLITCSWTHDAICFTNVSYEIIVKNSNNQTLSELKISESYFTAASYLINATIMELTSNDTISVYVTAVSGKLRSEPATTNVIREENENMVTKGSIGDSGGSSSAGLIGGIVGGVTVLIIVFAVIVMIIYKMVANRNSGSFSPDLEKSLRIGVPDTPVASIAMEKEKPATADIAYATIDFSKNEEPNESSLGTATSKQKDSNEDVLYAEPCRCCSKGCITKDKSMLCQGCDSSKPKDSVFSCGHQFCSKCSDKLEICPHCQAKPNDIIPLIIEPLPKIEKKNFCKKCAKSCIAHLCQNCFKASRPVVAVYYCGHQVCETCKQAKCSHCEEKKFIEMK